jgi:hypothetical protein
MLHVRSPVNKTVKIPKKAEGNRTPNSFAPKSARDPTVRYTSAGILLSSYDRKYIGNNVPNSSLPVFRMEYALYPNATSSGFKEGGIDAN